MNILAVDTTGEALSVALAAGGRTLSRHRPVKTPLDELLIPAVERFLKSAGLKWKDLDAVAACSGPGRFTGIRIGMAWAAVVSSRLKIPALAISRLEALAWKASSGSFQAVLEGWKEEKFVQAYKRSGQAPVAAAPPEWIRAEDWPRRESELRQQGFVPFTGITKAVDLLKPAEAMLNRKRRPKFAPLYLKPASYENKARRPG